MNTIYKTAHAPHPFGRHAFRRRAVRKQRFKLYPLLGVLLLVLAALLVYGVPYFLFCA